jgi:uncharacterized YigZ family protein
MSDQFLTIVDESEHRLEVKNSIFLAYAQRADAAAQAGTFLQSLVRRHADASHLCWAYRIGSEYRFSDGGEPGGTAGQPILRAIEGQNLDHVVVGVIRYFGGTLLGAGGLMRAYGGAAAEALRKAARREETPQVRVVVGVPFDSTGKLYHALDSHGAEDRSETYTDRGVRIACRLPGGRLESFREALRDATRDRFTLELQ